MKIEIIDENEICINLFIYKWNNKIQDIRKEFLLSTRFTNLGLTNNFYTDDDNGIIMYIDKYNILSQLSIHFYGSDHSFYPRNRFNGKILFLNNEIIDKNSIESLNCFEDIDRDEEEGDQKVVYYYKRLAISVNYSIENNSIEEIDIWREG